VISKELRLLKSGLECSGIKLTRSRSIAKAADQIALNSFIVTIVRFGNAAFPKMSIIVQHAANIYAVS
jgi:hypothetical protein